MTLKVLRDFSDLSYLAGSLIEVSPRFARFLILHHPSYFEVVGVADKEIADPPNDKMMRKDSVRTK